MPNDLGKEVDTLACALFRIRDAFADPTQVSFAAVHEEMERLEAVFNAKALIDAAFAHICERDNAGRHVGAKYPDAYLKECLGLSPREAYDRLARGKDLFGAPDIPESAEPEEPENGAEDLFGAPFETEQEARARQAEEERAREEARREARRRQEEARERADRVKAEKQQAIRKEPDRLLEAARGERARLLDCALREAEHRSLKDLRALVRRWVDAENRKHAAPENPNAGMEKRSLRIGPQNADGTYGITGRATAGDAALPKALLDKGAAPNSNMSPDVEDYRTPEQRAYDQFMKISRHFDKCQKPAGGGGASVVVSVTLDQLADVDATTPFPTNSGIEVTSFDLVRLGMGGPKTSCLPSMRQRECPSTSGGARALHPSASASHCWPRRGSAPGLGAQRRSVSAISTTPSPGSRVARPTSATSPPSAPPITGATTTPGITTVTPATWSTTHLLAGLGCEDRLRTGWNSTTRMPRKILPERGYAGSSTAGRSKTQTRRFSPR